MGHHLVGILAENVWNYEVYVSENDGAPWAFHGNIWYGNIVPLYRKLVLDWTMTYRNGIVDR